MSGFTLDTSGAVPFPKDNPEYGAGAWRWSDLDPFTQGYVEALFEELDKQRLATYRGAAWGSPQRAVPIRAAFSWLSPSALERIVHRCEFRLKAMNLPVGYRAEDGAIFWAEQQRGELAYFPPLTVSLDDAGKVTLADRVLS